MERLPLRRLVLGPPPAPDRILFYSIWFRGHVNARYAELLPRLARLDRYLPTCSDRRLARGLQYRAWRAGKPATDPLVLGLGGRRYRSLLTADNEQLAHFPGPAVADVDDPVFTPREVELLSRPGLAAYVVTAERAGRRLEALGVEKPWHVVPQGVALEALDPAEAAAVAAERRRPGELVVGYVAAWLLVRGDRGGDNPLYNVEHLLELWEEIRARAPAARLWLLGGPSEAVRRLLAGRDDVVLFGRVPRERVLAHVACFDVALYPRTADQGIQSSKVAEYLGAGVPTVAYRFEVTEELAAAGAGVLAATPRELVEAVVRLLADEPERRRIAQAARRAGEARDWRALARRYEELLDRYLPPA